MKLGVILYSIFAVLWVNATRLFLQVPGTPAPSDDTIALITGQFGALVLSVIGLWLAGYIINRLVKRADKLQEQINQDLRRRLDEAERIARENDLKKGG